LLENGGDGQPHAALLAWREAAGAQALYGAEWSGKACFSSIQTDLMAWAHGACQRGKGRSSGLPARQSSGGARGQYFTVHISWRLRSHGGRLIRRPAPRL
jgi:hypothetical protein